LLHDLDVELVIVPYHSRPPAGWAREWWNQFFVLDVLRDLATRTDLDDCAVLLDSDVVWTGQNSTESMWTALATDGSLTYDLGRDPESVQNGVTGIELGQLYTALTSEPIASISYTGGEIQGARGDVLRSISTTCDQQWEACRVRFERGESSVREEAHLLSIVYAILKLDFGSANPFIKRCWTQRYRNVDGTEADLALWHLPAEKRFGLREIYEEIHAVGPIRWIDMHRSDFVDHCGSHLGLPRSTARKRARDLYRRLHERVVR